jgi:acyl carrier protein
MHDEICEKIIFLLNCTELRLTATDSLVISGLLSSLQIVELASWLEGKYSIRFSDYGFNVYDFENISTIVEMINRMQQLAKSSD